LNNASTALLSKSPRRPAHCFPFFPVEKRGSTKKLKGKQLMGKVWFVGAGPGDPDLITVKGRDLVASAEAILFAGSLVSIAATRWASRSCEIADSKGMTLQQITAWLIEKAETHETVVRLQTGDPSLYGALVEMIQPLDEAGVESGVVPGVSSAMASVAAASESLTLPEVTQTVILTRVEGRTPMPPGEDLKSLALHHCTLCLFLSITLVKKIQSELIEAGWHNDAPVLIVHKATWPGEEIIVRSTIKSLYDDCRAEKINAQTMIVVSPALGARNWRELKKSKLYDRRFTHRFRRQTRKDDELPEGSS
jgi:precorrin-4/cobalt-precorrin-4 C11-methyltransferase